MLGPILFVLYINDLPSCIRSNVFMFADDTKVFKVIKHENDVQILQANLENFATWSSKWRLRFHPDKCKIMHVGTRAEHDHVYTLNVDNTVHELRYTDDEKDIGAIFYSKLEFDKHIYQQINKASSIMAVIRRSFIALHVRDSADLLAIMCAVERCFSAFLHSINNILPPLVFIKIFFRNEFTQGFTFSRNGRHDSQLIMHSYNRMQAILIELYSSDFLSRP